MGTLIFSQAVLLGGGIAFDPWVEDTTSVKGYTQRLNNLMGAKIRIPFGLIGQYQHKRAFREVYLESVRGYLYGLPNSSIPMSLRFLQLALIDSFRYEKNNKTANPKLEDLINWAENFKKEKTTAHGFQILRNMIHTESLLEDQDALEAIRHISIIADKFTSFDEAKVQIQCGYCRVPHIYGIEPNQYYIGNKLTLPCYKLTSRAFDIRVNI